MHLKEWCILFAAFLSDVFATSISMVFIIIIIIFIIIIISLLVSN